MVTDISADEAIANPLNDWDVEFTDALNFAWDIKKANPDAKIYVTGHSLGGALAQVVSQMFGFGGATFDPGGAANIAASTDFADWKSAKTSNDPTLILNQGVGADFLNYVIASSLVSSATGSHLGNQDQLDFFAYAAEEKLIIQSSTAIASYLLGNYGLGLGYLADGVAAVLTTYVFHGIDGILDLMSIKKSNQVTAELQQKIEESLQLAGTSGDIGSASLASNQTQVEFHSSQYYPTTLANDLDNIIYGYAGNDTIYSLAGNDTVYAGDGDDTISTAQGNDVIDAGDGSDTVYAGSGDDEINLGMGYQESVDGGMGRDTLTFDKSDQYFQAFYIETAQGLRGYTTASSFEQLRQGLEGAVSFRIYTTTAGSGGCNLSYRNIEAVNWTAGAGNDLLVYQDGTHYDGGAGTDAFYADFSGTTQALNWNADTNSFTPVDGVTVANIERFLLISDSGDDVIKATQGGQWHHVETGAGKDKVLLGAGDDYIDTGEGDDTIVAGDGSDTVYAGSGDDEINLGMGYQESVDGGTGRDTLTFDKSDQYFQAFYIETAQGGGGYTASSSFEQLRQGLEGAVSFRIYTTTAGSGGCNLSYRNIEAVNWTAGAGNDLLVYQGGTHYDGGAGTDAFYADFSGTTQALNWNADTNSFTPVDGVTVANIERFLLISGSGDDCD